MADLRASIPILASAIGARYARICLSRWTDGCSWGNLALNGISGGVDASYWKFFAAIQPKEQRRPLPRRRLVKVTLSVSADLSADLERYAAVHSQLHGEKVDAVTLAPHMLAWFLRNDREFRGQR